MAHAKKKSFSSSRVIKKPAVAKFGDVFLGSNDSSSDNHKNNKHKAPVRNESFTKLFAPESPIKSSLSKEELKKKFEFNEKNLAEPSMATCLDIAVIKCLFASQWIEDGIEWALNFLHKRLENINKADYNYRLVRKRSNSLPTPKRKFKEQESNRNKTLTRPKSFSNNDPANPQLKMPSFQELRRSSFSGLPGLSGFQALISSTSNTSFGRHGSEKVKHKKQKKHSSEMVGGKSDNKNKPQITSQGSMREMSKHYKEDVAKFKSKSRKDKTESDNSQEESLPPRPKSVTEFCSSKSEYTGRKFSLSENKLLDKNDHKGKSMPSLNLIDSKKGFSVTSIEDPSNSSSVNIVVPKISRSPNRPSYGTSSQNMPFPIITITEHSPVASMHFFQMDNESHKDMDNVSTSSYKFSADEGREKFQSKLFRSKTDTEINYITETSHESLASLNYVTKSGQISMVVILKAVHSITLKDSVCSTKVCKTIYNILNKLLNFKIITKRASSVYQVNKYKTYKPNYENAELSIHHLFMDTLFRIVKQLGCSRGCGEGRREVEALKLKDSVMKMLKVLHDISEYQFIEYCELLVTSHPVQEIIDIFHAFLGFCVENTNPSTTSGVSPFLSTLQPLKKSPFDQTLTGLKSGYFNNFTCESSTNKSELMFL